MKKAVFEVSDVIVAVLCEGQPSEAVELSVDELAFELVTVLQDQSSVAFGNSINGSSIILVAVVEIDH